MITKKAIGINAAFDLLINQDATAFLEKGISENQVSVLRNYKKNGRWLTENNMRNKLLKIGAKVIKPEVWEVPIFVSVKNKKNG